MDMFICAQLYVCCGYMRLIIHLGLQNVSNAIAYYVECDSVQQKDHCRFKSHTDDGWL